MAEPTTAPTSVLMVGANQAWVSAVRRALDGDAARWRLAIEAEVDGAIRTMAAGAPDCVLVGEIPEGHSISEPVRRLRRAAPALTVVALTSSTGAPALSTLLGDLLDGWFPMEYASPALIQRVIQECIGRRRAVAPPPDRADVERRIQRLEAVLRAARHELRTSVGIIWLSLESIRRRAKTADPEMVELLQSIRQETDSIVRTIDTLSVPTPTLEPSRDVPVA